MIELGDQKESTVMLDLESGVKVKVKMNYDGLVAPPGLSSNAHRSHSFLGGFRSNTLRSNTLKKIKEHWSCCTVYWTEGNGSLQIKMLETCYNAVYYRTRILIWQWQVALISNIVCTYIKLTHCKKAQLYISFWFGSQKPHYGECLLHSEVFWIM